MAIFKPKPNPTWVWPERKIKPGKTPMQTILETSVQEIFIKKVLVKLYQEMYIESVEKLRALHENDCVKTSLSRSD